ncbi:MAG: DUF3800 domain-containing protein [Candidatus Nitrosotenuis sp.]
MYIMYIDESGVERINDQTKYFVICGAIFHERDLTDMKKAMQDVRDNKLGRFSGSEIHIHDIYKGQKAFYSISLSEIKTVLTNIYTSLNNLQFSIISVAINKPELLRSKYYNYDILETAYTFLIERFDNFLSKNNNKGIIRIDKTSNKSTQLNQKDRKILELINQIRRNGTNLQRIKNIIEEPLFYDSALRKGLQVADASVYCVNARLNCNQFFDPYWKIIHSKLQTSPTGEISGYGLYVFPK